MAPRDVVDEDDSIRLFDESSDTFCTLLIVWWRSETYRFLPRDDKSDKICQKTFS